MPPPGLCSHGTRTEQEPCGVTHKPVSSRAICSVGEISFCSLCPWGGGGWCLGASPMQRPARSGVSCKWPLVPCSCREGLHHHTQCHLRLVPGKPSLPPQVQNDTRSNQPHVFREKMRGAPAASHLRGGVGFQPGTGGWFRLGWGSAGEVLRIHLYLLKVGTCTAQTSISCRWGPGHLSLPH